MAPSTTPGRAVYQVRRVASSPSRTGMRLSMSTTSGRNHWNDLTPASPSATTRTIWMPWSVSRIVTLVLGPLETFAHGPPSEVAIGEPQAAWLHGLPPQGVHVERVLQRSASGV